jgi:hypothetical protein
MLGVCAGNGFFVLSDQGTAVDSELQSPPMISLASATVIMDSNSDFRSRLTPPMVNLLC